MHIVLRKKYPKVITKAAKKITLREKCLAFVIIIAGKQKK